MSLDEPYCFCPGPSTRQFDGSLAMSHRDDRVLGYCTNISSFLSSISGARLVSFFSGGGTAANDFIALHLKELSGLGLIITNGEFGKRLVEHAEGAELDFIEQSYAWFEHFSIENVISICSEMRVKWIWYCLCETSTGMINRFDDICDYAHQNGINICLDTVSALGLFPFDMSKVWLASSSSGKFLFGQHGFSLVLQGVEDSIHVDCSRLPKSFRRQEIGHALSMSLNANLLQQFESYIEGFDFEKLNGCRGAFSDRLFDVFNYYGMLTYCYTNGLVTVVLPNHIPSVEFGDELLRLGFLINYKSEYLVDKNIIQLSLVKCVSGAIIDRLIASVSYLVGHYEESK